MEKLSDLAIKPHWNTENDNVIEDFYIKTLSNSIRYDRASLGFGSTILTDVAKGLDGLIDKRYLREILENNMLHNTLMNSVYIALFILNMTGK